MPKHEHFEELAAIATLGGLAPLQAEELSLHLADCIQCRKVHDEFVQLHDPLRQPITPEMDLVIGSRREQIKGAVLQAIAEKQSQLPIRGRNNGWPGATVLSLHALRPVWTGLIAAGIGGLFFLLGIHYDRHILNISKPPASIPVTLPVQTAPVAAIQEPKVQSKEKDADDKFIQLESDLQVEKQSHAKLEETVAEQAHQLDEFNAERALLQQQFDAQAQNVRRIESSLTGKTEELKQAEAAKTENVNEMVALRYEVQDLTEKLNGQKQSLDREQQLLASGRDIRDIIGARNLHIIDVYDRGPEGKLKKSFARAFYTEGKSLIFYAYDLPAHSTENGRFAYTAWGESSGNKKTVRNLGILLNDDKGQMRWVLNFSDPKVLAEIDSVFVTLERADTDNEQPQGKRMLTAYLDSRVNHP